MSVTEDNSLDAVSTLNMSPCRMVTPEEVAHYEEFGWAKLKKFIDPVVVGQLLATARARMGEDGDGNDPYGKKISFFNAEYGAGLTVPFMRAILESAAKSAKALMTQVHPDVGVRYHSDVFAPKLPSAKNTRNAGNGLTTFHQDFITLSIDRSAGMTFWFPLEAYGPESGTMSFINGSHRMGVMGNYSNYAFGDALDDFPRLRELPVSDPLSYEVGDINVHSHLTVHGAGKNLRDTPRWAYIMTVNPSDAVWTGATPEAFDATGMKPYHPFDDAVFPILA